MSRLLVVLGAAVLALGTVLAVAAFVAGVPVLGVLVLAVSALEWLAAVYAAALLA